MKGKEETQCCLKMKNDKRSSQNEDLKKWKRKKKLFQNKRLQGINIQKHVKAKTKKVC